jgi:hypothetical protein
MDNTAEIRFDNWTLRGQPRELLHDGARVRLQEQPLQILEELLARPARSWRGTADRAALAETDRRLRRRAQCSRTQACGGSRRRSRDAALHRKRSRATVIASSVRCCRRSAVDSAVGSAVQPDRHRDAPVVAMAAVVLVAVSAQLSGCLRRRACDATERASRAIAVLPFVDLSAQQDQQYFSDGLTEELISRLAADLPLRVIARTSSFSFKGGTSTSPRRQRSSA